MNTFQIIKDEALTARKNKERVKADLLTTLVSEIAMKAKNEGNREVQESDVTQTIKKFLKNIDKTLEVRPTDEKMLEEKIILNQIPIQLVDIVDTAALVQQVIDENPTQFASLKDKPQNVGWFVGQIMKVTGGKANPATVKEEILSRI